MADVGNVLTHLRKGTRIELRSLLDVEDREA